MLLHAALAALLRTDVGGEPTVRRLLSRVRATTLDALDRAQLPFHNVAVATGLGEPQVLLVHHEQAELGGTELGTVEVLSTGTTSAELTISRVAPDRWRATWTTPPTCSTPRTRSGSRRSC